MQRHSLASVTLAFLVLLALVLYTTRTRQQPTAGPLPDPNGHSDFVAAARMIQGDLPPDARRNPDLAAAFTTSNRPALERLRIGLGRDCVVPPIEVSNAQSRIADVGDLKRLAQLVAEEAREARRRGDWDALVRSSIDGIDLGLRLARGGVAIDLMTATAVEGLCRKPLEEALEEIPAAHARTAARELLRLDSTREPVRRVEMNEEAFARRRSPWYLRIPLNPALRQATRRTFVSTQQAALGTTFATRNLAQNLAARAWTLERGAPPASPGMLVPDYLPAVPTNPVTGMPLKRFYGTALPAYAQIPLE
jgi:hypothetical protein